MSIKFEVALVAAIGNNRELGRKNEMPWSVPDEMRNFIAVTRDRICIAGANTAKSIGKALKGRTCFVVADPQRTKDVGMFVENGWIVCSTFEKALEDAVVMASRGGSKPMVVKGTVPVICVIGGAWLYAEALPRADYLVLSHIKLDVPDADAFFPEVELGDFAVQPLRGKRLPIKNDLDQEVTPAWQTLFYARPGTEVYKAWHPEQTIAIEQDSKP